MTRSADMRATNFVTNYCKRRENPSFRKRTNSAGLNNATRRLPSVLGPLPVTSSHVNTKNICNALKSVDLVLSRRYLRWYTEIGHHGVVCGFVPPAYEAAACSQSQSYQVQFQSVQGISATKASCWRDSVSRADQHNLRYTPVFTRGL